MLGNAQSGFSVCVPLGDMLGTSVGVAASFCSWLFCWFGAYISSGVFFVLLHFFKYFKGVFVSQRTQTWDAGVCCDSADMASQL